MYAVIAFPVIICWNVRISLRKKLILTGTFGLVALTIAVTIVRGSVLGTYKKFNTNERLNLNPGWMWFWIFIEFAVGKSTLKTNFTHIWSLTPSAFLIACIISFRALFAQRKHRSYDYQRELKQQQARSSSGGSKPKKTSSIFERMRSYHDSLLTSFRELETQDDMRLPQPESVRKVYVRTACETYTDFVLLSLGQVQFHVHY
jgi:hypothetical protein